MVTIVMVSHIWGPFCTIKIALLLAFGTIVATSVIVAEKPIYENRERISYKTIEAMFPASFPILFIFKNLFP